jgi:hypothetical protein
MCTLMNKPKLIIPLIVGLAVCIAAGCKRYLNCCPPANTVLAQAEAESISGVSMKLAYDLLDSQRSSCAYENGRTGDDRYSVVLDLRRFEEGGGPSDEAAHREMFAKNGGNVENITGVGDSAFLSHGDGEFLLYARKGTFGIELRAKSVLPPNEARQRLITVARLVPARLE